MKCDNPISAERAKQLEELEQFENAILSIVVVSKSLIDEMFKRHKELNVSFESRTELLAWKKISDGVGVLDYIAFNSPHCSYDTFKKGVDRIKFIIMELISRCNASDERLWRFHNLLKSFPIVYSAIAPTIEEENKVFSSVFEKPE